LFDRLKSWNNQNTENSSRLKGLNKSTDKSSVGFGVLRKQIEMIGIEIKDLNEQAETGRFELKTKFINQHFINVNIINIRVTWIGHC
jgi:hypothetical protein